MNEPQSPGNLSTLIAAAKSDGPGVASAAKIWSAVSTSIAPGAAPVAAGSVGAVKMLAVTLFGSTVTVGLAATALYFGLPRHADDTRSSARQTLSAPASDGHFSPAVAPPVSQAPFVDLRRAAPVAMAPVASNARLADRGQPTMTEDSSASNRRPAPVHVAQPEDTLAREASLVAAARSALARGDAQAALREIRATHALHPRQMRPEELAVEAQSLRALGMDNDADAVELSLKVKYPESALAR